MNFPEIVIVEGGTGREGKRLNLTLKEVHRGRGIYVDPFGVDWTMSSEEIKEKAELEDGVGGYRIVGTKSCLA